MATDIVSQLANSLAKTAVGEKELSYKDQVKKWDDAVSGEDHQSLITAHEHTSYMWFFGGFFACFLMICKTCFPVVDVVKEIEGFEGLQALRLEGNTIGVQAAQAIAKALETKSELKVRGFKFLFS